jgi:hypothetical protein
VGHHGDFTCNAGRVALTTKTELGKGRNDQDAEIFVANLALSVLGGIQPDRLGR